MSPRNQKKQRVTVNRLVVTFTSSLSPPTSRARQGTGQEGDFVKTNATLPSKSHPSEEAPLGSQTHGLSLPQLSPVWGLLPDQLAFSVGLALSSQLSSAQLLFYRAPKMCPMLHIHPSSHSPPTRYGLDSIVSLILQMKKQGFREIDLPNSST